MKGAKKPGDGLGGVRDRVGGDAGGRCRVWKLLHKKLKFDERGKTQISERLNHIQRLGEIDIINGENNRGGKRLKIANNQ
jgi:hypothetical protein